MKKTSPDYSKDGKAESYLNQIRKDYNKAVEQLEIMRATGKTPLPVKFKVVGIESAITLLDGVIPRGELEAPEQPPMSLNTHSKLINWSEIARRLNVPPTGFLNRLNRHGAARALTDEELASIRELIREDLNL